MTTRNMYRKMQLVIVSMAIGMLCLLVLLIGVAIHGFEQAKDPANLTPRLELKMQDWRPDISHCFVDERIDLWDCIRHEDEVANELRRNMYREDI